MGETNLDISQPYPWLRHVYQNLITKIQDVPAEYRAVPQRFVRISFSELQRLHLRKLQCKLAKHAVRIHFETVQEQNAEGLEVWEEDLKDYIEALQNYDYLISRYKGDADPSFLTAERDLDKDIIESALSGMNIHPDQLNPCDNSGPKDPLRPSRSDTMRNRTRKRLWMAVIGGAFLVGPMWLMVLHNTLYTGLVSTTVFVTVFGVMMAFIAEDENNVLSSTAAYAAVLVVFVGLNNNGS